ncbi:MAG: ComEC/Rec2 family competence protein [Lentisphaerae bacterium]|nr:ComEC/Rec2 family competence protein [Lentisphaerota bacterium]
MEKKEFSTPDLPFALGVICVCAAGLGYQLFLLLPVLVVCRFINRKFLFFTLCGIAAGVFSLAFHLHLKQERLEQLPAKGTFLNLVCQSCDSTVSFVPGLPQASSFTANVLKIDGRNVTGNIKILIHAGKSGIPVRYSEKFSVSGGFSPVEEDNHFGKYLESRNLHGTLQAEKIKSLSPPGGFIYHLSRLRDNLLERTLHGISSDTVKIIISTMFFGVSGGFDNTMKQTFLNTGTLHLFSISGMHLAAIAALLLIPARLLPRRIRYWVVAALCICYALSTGANPPVMRALIVICFWCAGKALLFYKDSANLLALTAAVLLLVSPELIGNIGAQFSFFITAILILTAGQIAYYRAETGVFMSAIPRNPLTFKWQKKEKFKWFLISSVILCSAAFAGGIGISAANLLPVLPGSVFINLILMFCVPLLFLLIGVRVILGEFFPSAIIEYIFGLLEDFCFEGSQFILPAGLAVSHVCETVIFCVALLFACGSSRRGLRYLAVGTAAGLLLLWLIRPCFLAPRVIFISSDSEKTPVIAIIEPAENLGFFVNASCFEMCDTAADFMRRAGIFRSEAVLFTQSKNSFSSLCRLTAAVPPSRIRLPDAEGGLLLRYLAENRLKNVVSGGREREFVKIFKEKSFCRLEYFNPGSKLSFRMEWNDTSAGRIVSINGAPARFMPWGNRQEILYYEFR